MNRFISGIEWFNRRLGQTVAWLLPLMVAVYFIVVVMRYGLDMGSIALQETVTYMHALLFMLAAAWTLQHDGHVRVDVFYSRLGPVIQAWVNLIGSLVFLLPLSVFLFAVSLEYVTVSWQLREGSAESQGLPFVYLLKSVILLMAIQLALQGMVTAWRSLQQIRAD